jgi:hypothetical protein
MAVFWTASLTAIVLSAWSVLRGVGATLPLATTGLAGVTAAPGSLERRCRTELADLLGDLDRSRDDALRSAETHSGRTALTEYRSRAAEWQERWMAAAQDCSREGATPRLDRAHADLGRLRYAYEGLVLEYARAQAPLRRATAERIRGIE